MSAHTTTTADTAHTVLIHCERIEVRMRSLPTSSKRHVHGPDLLVYGSPNVFRVYNEPQHTWSLPCGAQHVRLDNPAPMHFVLHEEFVGRAEVFMDPLACLGFELMSRHCKSDRGEEVSHKYGYGQLPLAQLHRCSKSNGDGDGGSDSVSVVLVDRPAEFEVVYATNVCKDNNNNGKGAEQSPEDLVTLLKLHDSYRSTHDDHDFFERAVVTFVRPRVQLPSDHVRLDWRNAADAVHSTDMSDPYYWDFLGRGANSVRAFDRLRRVMSDHRERTYDPYAGRERFSGTSAMDKMWANYFVPTYRLGCGVDVPSALALMCTWFNAEPQERLYSHLLRAQLTRNGMSVQQYMDGCRAVLAVHGTWANEAADEHRSGNERHRRSTDLPADDPRFTHRHLLQHGERRALDYAVQALASMAAACCYTTDFAEVPRSGLANDVLQIVTEQFETAGLLTHAIDCEDGAAWVYRLWLHLVRFKGRWQDPVVALTARMLDLYVVSIQKMHCGECHILAVFWLRDYAYASMRAGYEHAVCKLDNAEERQRWEQGIRDTCLWPAYMYQGSEPGSLGHRTDLWQQMLPPHPRRVQWPVPHVLYAESTRASCADQAPHDTLVYEDAHHSRVHGTTTSARIRLTRRICDLKSTVLNTLEPYVAFPQFISCQEAVSEPTRLSPFYRGLVMACFLPPVYALVLQDLQQHGRGAARCEFPRTREALTRAHFFADAAHTDMRRPHTFGVYHASFVSGDPACAVVPLAPLNLETLVWTAKVCQVEAPVTPGLLPEHLRHVPVEQLGRMESMDHLLHHKHLTPLLQRGAEFMQQYATAAHDNTYAPICFLPHNTVAADPRTLTTVSSIIPHDDLYGVQAMRIPLAVAPVATPIASPEHGVTQETLNTMMADMELTQLDYTQYVAFLEHSYLQERARELGVTDRYTTVQWDALRHHLGGIVRRAPLCTNVLTLVVSVV